MPKPTNIYEAKAKFSMLLKEVVETGRPVIISKNGKPYVDIVPHTERKDPLKQIPELSGAVYKGDPCEGVRDEDWPADLR
jgi:prevent-host-death family protein